MTVCCRDKASHELEEGQKLVPKNLLGTGKNLAGAPMCVWSDIIRQLFVAKFSGAEAMILFSVSRCELHVRNSLDLTMTSDFAFPLI